MILVWTLLSLGVTDSSAQYYNYNCNPRFVCFLNDLFDRNLVCGSDGRTYLNRCRLRAHGICYGRRIFLIHHGPCLLSAMSIPRAIIISLLSNEVMRNYQRPQSTKLITMVKYDENGTRYPRIKQVKRSVRNFKPVHSSSHGYSPYKSRKNKHNYSPPRFRSTVSTKDKKLPREQTLKNGKTAKFFKKNYKRPRPNSPSKEGQKNSSQYIYFQAFPSTQNMKKNNFRYSRLLQPTAENDIENDSHFEPSPIFYGAQYPFVPLHSEDNWQDTYYTPGGVIYSGLPYPTGQNQGMYYIPGGSRYSELLQLTGGDNAFGGFDSYFGQSPSYHTIQYPFVPPLGENYLQGMYYIPGSSRYSELLQHTGRYNAFGGFDSYFGQSPRFYGIQYPFGPQYGEDNFQGMYYQPGGSRYSALLQPIGGDVAFDEFDSYFGQGPNRIQYPYVPQYGGNDLQVMYYQPEERNFLPLLFLKPLLMKKPFLFPRPIQPTATPTAHPATPFPPTTNATTDQTGTLSTPTFATPFATPVPPTTNATMDQTGTPETSTFATPFATPFPPTVNESMENTRTPETPTFITPSGPIRSSVSITTQTNTTDPSQTPTQPDASITNQPDSSQTTEAGSTETPEAGSTETPEAGSTETPEAGSSETTEAGSSETSAADSDETTDKDSSRLLKNHLKMKP